MQIGLQLCGRITELIDLQKKTCIIIHNVMMQVCPFCGYELQHELSDGLTHCSHCNQIVESSDLNQLLSAAWQVRKNHYSIQQIKWHTKLSDDMAILVYTFVSEYNYSHEEFLKFLNKLGVAHKSYIKFEKSN
jgi:hypothetical protein